MRNLPHKEEKSHGEDPRIVGLGPAAIRDTVGDARVILAFSGGVDSTVAAMRAR